MSPIKDEVPFNEQEPGSRHAAPRDILAAFCDLGRERPSAGREGWKAHRLRGSWQQAKQKLILNSGFASAGSDILNVRLKGAGIR
jgi:hypothetical protein